MCVLPFINMLLQDMEENRVCISRLISQPKTNFLGKEDEFGSVICRQSFPNHISLHTCVFRFESLSVTNVRCSLQIQKVKEKINFLDWSKRCIEKLFLYESKLATRKKDGKYSNYIKDNVFTKKIHVLIFPLYIHFLDEAVEIGVTNAHPNLNCRKQFCYNLIAYII